MAVRQLLGYLFLLVGVFPASLFASDPIDPEAGRLMAKHQECVRKHGVCPDVEYAPCTLEYSYINDNLELKTKNLDSSLPTKEISEKECFQKLSEVAAKHMDKICDGIPYNDTVISFPSYTTERDEKCKCQHSTESMDREMFCKDKKFEFLFGKARMDELVLTREETAPLAKKRKTVKFLKDWKN